MRPVSEILRKRFPLENNAGIPADTMPAGIIDPGDTLRLR
jgi:hypothetical protein